MAHDTKQMESLLVNTTEAAAALGIGRSTIYVLISAGEIPVVRIGKSIRIPTTGLRQWVAAREAGTDGVS